MVSNCKYPHVASKSRYLGHNAEIAM